MTIENARVLTKDFNFETRSLSFDGEVITQESAGGALDAGGMMVIPGLIDLHFHGCVGYDFCDGTQEAIRAIADYQAKNGVTGIAPASMTLPEETLTRVFETAAAYESDSGAVFCGINMEGPFFCAAKKGAQNAAYLKEPDLALYRRLQMAAKGNLKLVDVAPELDGAIPFIEQVSKEAVVSLGHTAADYETAMAAFRAGASHVTHLYNAMLPFTHRAPGVVGAASDAGAKVELICDGIHIADPAIRATYKLFGDEQIILISDSMMATGLEDGMYSLGGQAVKVTGNLATLEDGTIAGSATNLFDCMRHAVACGIPLESAVRMAAYNPARELGVLDRMGTLEPGKLANFVLMDDELNIHAVYVKGKPAYSDFGPAAA